MYILEGDGEEGGAGWGVGSRLRTQMKKHVAQGPLQRNPRQKRGTHVIIKSLIYLSIYQSMFVFIDDQLLFILVNTI